VTEVGHELPLLRIFVLHPQLSDVMAQEVAEHMIVGDLSMVVACVQAIVLAPHETAGQEASVVLVVDG
jgi:hypothetical protein